MYITKNKAKKFPIRKRVICTFINPFIEQVLEKKPILVKDTIVIKACKTIAAVKT
jgi:hypothetical protein